MLSPRSRRVLQMRDPYQSQLSFGEDGLGTIDQEAIPAKDDDQGGTAAPESSPASPLSKLVSDMGTTVRPAPRRPLSSRHENCENQMPVAASACSPSCQHCAKLQATNAQLR